MEYLQQMNFGNFRYAHCYSNRYKIPGDISVIVFTTSFMGENFLPSLTTVEQFAGEQGRQSVKTPIVRIHGDLPKKPIIKTLQI